MVTKYVVRPMLVVGDATADADETTETARDSCQPGAHVFHHAPHPCADTGGGGGGESAGGTGRGTDGASGVVILRYRFQ